MKIKNPDVIKSSGEKARFSVSKLRNSLLKSGANKSIVNGIIKEIKKDLHSGISTHQLYKQAYSLLQQYEGAYASRYKLKKAIYELGPSGFPFEKFINEILKCSGFKTKLNLSLKGKCVTHEIDIEGTKNSNCFLIECKFHSEEGRKCDVKIPLYINSRFNDINASAHINKDYYGWLITNTHFTQDAITYGECVGIRMLSWDYPEENSLKSMIDKYATYPITSSTILTSAEKLNLLSKDVVLGNSLLEHPELLELKDLSESRKEKILNEFRLLCKTQPFHE